MKLMTAELEKKMPKLNTETDEKSLAYVHYFNPSGAGDWFGMTYDKASRTMFGYVSLFGDHNDELGYFSLDELESITTPFGLSIEREIYWTPKSLEDIQKVYTHA